MSLLITCLAYGQTSGVRVSHYKSEMDGKRTAELVVSAASSYQWRFQVIRPELIIACSQKGDEHTFSTVLRSGVLGSGEDYIELRVKFDGADAEKLGWWHNDSDPRTYFRTESVETISWFVQAKTALIEVMPFMTGRKVVAHFDLRGLTKAFANSAECKLPE